MENASKALIIAGAILISILLISVGILVFNSTKGVTDNAEKAGDVMMTAAAEENAKIVLNTMDIKDDVAFNKYISSKYEGRTLTAKEVVELCTLITERSKKLTGKIYERTETHITSHNQYEGKTMVVYWNETNKKIVYQNLDENKKYRAEFTSHEDYENNYTIRCYAEEE